MPYCIHGYMRGDRERGGGGGGRQFGVCLYLYCGLTVVMALKQNESLPNKLGRVKPTFQNAGELTFFKFLTGLGNRAGDAAVTKLK